MQGSIALLLAAATATTAASVYTTAAPVYTTPATTASTDAVPTSYSAQCDGVYNACIAEYTSKGQSPFFPECNSRRAACQAGASYSTGPVPTFPAASTTTTAAVTTESYSAQCQAVYNSCIAEYTSKGQSPFFPECNSRRAACQGGGSYSTGVASTTTSAVTTSTSYSAKCQDVYNSCIASYTSQGQSPFFPECNSRRAACQAGASYSTGSVPTFPVASSSTTLKTSASTYAQTTKAPSSTTTRGGVATYTGAATAPQVPLFGVLAAGAVFALF